MGIKISKDHLHPSVIESITSLIGDLNQLETTAKGNAVEAINELLDKLDNSAELEVLEGKIAENMEKIKELEEKNTEILNVLKDKGLNVEDDANIIDIINNTKMLVPAHSKTTYYDILYSNSSTITCISVGETVFDTFTATETALIGISFTGKAGQPATPGNLIIYNNSGDRVCSISTASIIEGTRTGSFEGVRGETYTIKYNNGINAGTSDYYSYIKNISIVTYFELK